MRTGVALALAAALAGCKYANREVGEPHPKPPPTSERFSQQEAIARVVELDGDALVLERPGKPLRIEVPEQTLVYLDGRVGTPAELRVGMRVKISYDAIRGPPRANWIQVLELRAPQRP